METSQAIMAFSQSEKVKTSLICASQSLELLAGMSFSEKEGAQKVIRMNIEMMRRKSNWPEILQATNCGMRLNGSSAELWS